MTLPDALVQDLTALSPADQTRFQEYVRFLRWQAERGGAASPTPDACTSLDLNLLEHFAGADVRA